MSAGRNELLAQSLRRLSADLLRHWRALAASRAEQLAQALQRYCARFLVGHSLLLRPVLARWRRQRSARLACLRLRRGAAVECARRAVRAWRAWVSRQQWRRAQQHALRARFLVRRCALWALLARQRRRRREQARALAELAAVDSKSIRLVSQDHHAPAVEPRGLCLRAQACLGFELYRACLWLVGAGLWRALDIEGETRLCPCACETPLSLCQACAMLCCCGTTCCGAR